MKKYTYSICACARMEERSINEWIAYHQSIGIQKFYIYGNDDDYRILLDVLYPLLYNNKDLVTFIHYNDVGAQSSMYLHFLKYFGYESEWISFVDLDEFMSLRKNNDISSFVKNYSNEFESIQLNWLNYGTSGNISRPNGSVLREYNYRSKYLDVHTKHITKFDSIYNCGVSGPFWHTIDSDVIPTCNVRGERYSFMNTLRDSSFKIDYQEYLNKNSDEMIDCGSMVHYVLKSEEDFLRRIQRSVKGDFSNQISYSKYLTDEVARQNYLEKLNEVKDTFMMKYWESLTLSKNNLNLHFV